MYRRKTEQARPEATNASRLIERFNRAENVTAAQSNVEQYDIDIAEKCSGWGWDWARSPGDHHVIPLCPNGLQHRT
jgi:hypothetical protein